MDIFIKNGEETNFEQILLSYIEEGRKNDVLSILELEGIHPCEFVNNFGTTLLHYAAQFGNDRLAKHLINLEAEIEAQNLFEETPLMLAVEANQEAIVNLLLEAKADPLRPDINGKCALAKVCQSQENVDLKNNIMTALLDKVTIDSLNHNSDYLKSKQFHTDCPLYHFITHRNPEVARMLLLNGSPVDAKTANNNETSLHIACKQLDLQNIKILLEFNADINAKNGNGLTPLACVPVELHGDQSKTLEITRVLIAAGADLIDRVSKKFIVESHLMRGNKEVVQALLESQIDLKFTDKQKDTVFHILTRNINPGVLQIIPDIESAVKVRSEEEYTMLHVAAVGANPDSVQYLLSKGADVNARDAWEHTPLYWILTTFWPFKKYDKKFYDHINCIDILIEHGSDLVLCTDDFADFSSSEHEHILLTEPVLSVLVLLEESGQTIEETMRNQIESCLAYKNIFDSRKLKVQELKRIEIGQTASLFDFLIANDEKISTYARNQKIISNLTTAMKDYNLELYYYRKLRKNFVKVSHLAEVRKKATIVVNELFEKLYNISVEIIAKKIVDYVEDPDLSKINQ